MSSLTIFFKRLTTVEVDNQQWFENHKESLIYYFDRMVSTTEPDYVFYKFKENKVPRLPYKIKSKVDFIINDGTSFKIAE